MERAYLREFNALGLQLRPQAAKLVTEFLNVCEDPQGMVENIVEFTKSYLRSRQSAVDPVIDVDVIRSVLECMHSRVQNAEGLGADEVTMLRGAEALELGDGVYVYDATTEVTPYEFRRATKDWAPAHEQPGVLAPPDTKAKVYADRYHLLLQRMLMEGKLVAEEEAASSGLLPGQRVLTKVESLQGNPGNKITFGLISRSSDEKDADGKRRWVLEDLHKVYPITLLEEATAHLITDSCFVLADGRLEGDRFVVRHLDVPAAVPRTASLQKDLAPRQMFGGNLGDEQLNLLAEAEPSNPDGFYVVLAEVHLDSVRVLEKLTDLFNGYEQFGPPTAYVFMGSFSSSGFRPNEQGVRAYRDGFERLKFMMRGLHNHIQRGTRFIFIAGPTDPGAQLLPRMPLPGYLTADLAKDIPNVMFATNPCRVRHFSKELVFFRHDVLRLLRRHEVLPMRDPTSGGAVSLEHAQTEMVRFILDQAHLVPLPLEQSNILWAYDHTLRLYPLPDAVFIGGVSRPFDCAYQECKFCSVGPFHRDSEFYAYHPVKGVVEPCDVPDRAG